MSTESPNKRSGKQNGPKPTPKVDRHKNKALPEQDLTEELDKLELDEEVSKQAKIKKLLNLRAKCAKQLNDQQQDYLREYFVDFNISKAGVRAGYTEGYAKSGELMRYKPVVDYIQITRRINDLKIGVTGEFVLAEFNKLAKVSASDLYDVDGTIIPPHKLPAWVAAAISEVKQKTWTTDGRTITEYTYKLHSKVAALDALGKHTGIYERDNKQKTPEYAQVVVYLPDNGRDIIEPSNDKEGK